MFPRRRAAHGARLGSDADDHAVAARTTTVTSSENCVPSMIPALSAKRAEIAPEREPRAHEERRERGVARVGCQNSVRAPRKSRFADRTLILTPHTLDVPAQTAR